MRSLVLVGATLALLATASPATVSQADPELSLDRVTVRQIQDVLRERGFSPGPSDGQIGAQTRTAIEGLQRALGSPVTGHLNFDLAMDLLKEHELMLVQLVFKSDDPTHFEEYLSLFPSGTFRSLVQDRLTELRGDDLSDRSNGRNDVEEPAADAPPEGLKCDSSQPSTVTCLMKIAERDAQPCYVWSPGVRTNERVTWSGRCENQVADGPGQLIWTWSDGGVGRQLTATGELLQGEPYGLWRLDHKDGPLLGAEYIAGGRLYRSWGMDR